MKKKKVILIIITLIIIFSLFFYYENNFLLVTNYKIVDNNIPQEFNNYKIIQISDYHNNKNKLLNNKLIKTIKKESPNFIVITGDLIDASKTDINQAINLIKNINYEKVFYVTGNHEASTESYKKLKELLEENKVTILDNRIEIIKENSKEINLIGIDDPSFYNRELTNDSDITKKEIESVSYNKDNYSILLSHRPEQLERYAESKINLVLTGHAHGGQIRLPFIGGLVAPNQGLFPKYTNGIHKKDKTTMIISRGIGNSILPLRINNRPELVVITLKNN